MSNLLHELGIAGAPIEGLIPVVLVFALAALATWRFMPRVRQYALKVGTADEPNARRINKEPLPNIGGLAIFAGVIAALVLAIALKGQLLERVQVQLLSIMLGATLMLIVGFIDDQFSLSPLFRLAAQTLAAGLLVVNGIRIDVPGLAPVFDILITLVWVVGITNAVNLMDGIDGLVGGLGFIASSFLLAISAQFPERAASTLLLAAVAGGCLGFLRHNFNPSRIILGDAGATFIGFTLAAVSILGTVKFVAAASLIAPLLFLAVPIIDTTQVVVRRLRSGSSPFEPDKRHLHHTLLHSGLGQRRSVLLLWAFILVMNVLGMIVQGIKPIVIMATVIAVIVLLALGTWPRVREVRREERQRQRLGDGGTM